MGIIRRLLTTGEHIGHASEAEARAFYAAKAVGGNVGTVTTPEGQSVTLHEDVTDEHVEAATQAHTSDAGQTYQGPPQEGWVHDPNTGQWHPPDSSVAPQQQTQPEPDKEPEHQ